MGRDYYELLDVSRDADAEQIKKAYRKVAMRYHPDRNDEADAEDRFKEVTEAYEILKDPGRRDLYDRYGEAGVRRGAGGEPPFGGFGSFADAVEVFMREFGSGGFGEFFAGGRARPGPRKGSTLKVSVMTTLEEAATGSTRKLRVSVMDRCKRCGGAGAEPGSGVVECATCSGVGEIREVQRSMLGQFVSVRPCHVCGGRGQQIQDPCRDCNATGRVKDDRTVEIEIPAGISSEDYLKLKGRGNAGPQGGPPGDLIVAVAIEPHERFERRGDDLILDAPVTFSQAATGADIEVPTIMGEARLSIPAGIQSGQVLRLRGQGMPRLRDAGRGDQLVRVHVWTPTELSREQREAFESLASIEDAPPEPRRGEDPSFWDRVKAAFTA
ncbi:MAG: molecular chaperone DnaJ [Gemmatimonadota bacterium]|nr:molecular chaperone DnaJ [Gemmatimonadota bacterium]